MIPYRRQASSGADFSQPITPAKIKQVHPHQKLPLRHPTSALKHPRSPPHRSRRKGPTKEVPCSVPPVLLDGVLDRKMSHGKMDEIRTKQVASSLEMQVCILSCLLLPCWGSDPGPLCARGYEALPLTYITFIFLVLTDYNREAEC